MNNIRLFHAVDEMLYTDKKITRIALDNGFPTMASFNKVFKEVYNMTPSGYRTSVRQKTKEEVQDTESKEQIEQRVKKYLAGNTAPQDEVAAKNLDLFTVDAKETTELKKNWNAIINIGKVDALLDSEMQQQVLIMKQELGFRYVRVWNIFVQDMYEEKDGSWHYNFSRVDRGKNRDRKIKRRELTDTAKATTTFT